ncbi:Protein angel 2 [Thelohanellus kitauei]|uniref:Nocturnin n=1 Tax=Thelohanellus kitauei TaxID=669202 RepID=A0A0C2MLW7_THEKT|nr:Protein angel 2 [Thelohanellus kitauei]
MESLSRSWVDNNVENYGFEMRICSYNILSNFALNNNLYLYSRCLPEHLNPEYRSNLLLSELSQLRSDVLCLQEVDQEIFDTVVTKHCLSTQSSCSYYRGSDFAKNGCCIIYKNQKFELVESERIVFAEPEFSYRESMYVAVVNVLKNKSNSGKNDSIFIICTTHLVYGQDLELVRQRQLKHILNIINEKSALYNDPPVILCGDFNSLPTNELVSIMIGRPPNPESVLFGYDTSFSELYSLSNQFQFKSAYPLEDENESFQSGQYDMGFRFTSCVDGCMSYVDYIFVGRRGGEMFDADRRFSIRGYLDLPEVMPYILPNERLPSDHLPIKAKLSFSHS